MFCQNCGRENSEQQNFCMFCGNRISSHTRINSVREEQISLINSLITFFSEKAIQYEEYNNTITTINKLKYVRSKAALIWGIILSSAIFTISLSSITRAPHITLILMLFGLVSGGSLIFLFVALNKNRKSKLKLAIQRYSMLSEELSNHYKFYGNCPIGIEYTDPVTLFKIKNIIKTGRADSIKEALNILLDDAHRRRMEDLAVKTAQYVESTNKLTKVAAVASIADLAD